MLHYIPRLQTLCSIGLLCYCCCYCCFVSLVHGQSYNYRFDIAKAFKTKRQLGDVIVTSGVAVGHGPVPVRPEIRRLQLDPDKWSLYILALDLMQKTVQSDPTSWFSISGIHGVPFEEWNGVVATPGNENSGYCHHQNILFPTWHRAYMALYEQELCARVQFIASLYPGDLKHRFETAAENCRAPYFDWAALPSSPFDSLLPPSIGDHPQINVSGPAGTQLMANPLFTYQFSPPNPTVFQNVTPWADWSSTRRAPTSLSADALSNNSAINHNLATHIIQNQQRLYNLLSSYDNYTIFSNVGWTADPGQYDSIEAIHDNVHAMLGGIDGHMTVVPFSAFDPLFFLHHCQVDRLLTLWQVFHPDAWIEPQASRLGTYTTSFGEILDSTSALTPFYATSNGKFWNSDMIRDPSVLGYTYAELASSGISISNRSSILEGQAHVAGVVNQLYGRFSVNNINIQSKRKEDSEIHLRPQQDGSYLGDKSGSMPVNKIISQQGVYREWIANIRVVRQALDGPFSVRLSLGHSNQSSYVGSMGVFAFPPEIAMKMQMAPGAEYITSVVPLTAALVEKVADETLSSMDPEEVGPYLKHQLATSVMNMTKSEVDPTIVSGLSIEVVSWPVQASSSENQLPVWGVADFKLSIL